MTPHLWFEKLTDGGTTRKTERKGGLWASGD